MMLMRVQRLEIRLALHSILAGMLMHGVYLGGIFWAVSENMPAGIAALITGLQPLIATLLAAIFLGERTLWRHRIGLVLGFAGTVLVVLPKFGGIGSGLTVATIAATMTSTIAISIGTVWQKRYCAHVHLIAGTVYQYFGAAILMCALSLMWETRHFTLTLELVFAMGWLVFVLSIGAILLLMVMIRSGKVARVSAVFYLVPSVTILLAWLLFGEQVSLVQLLGLVIAAAGVALATRPDPGLREETTAPAEAAAPIAPRGQSLS